MRESTRGVIYIGLDANARVGCDLSRPPPSPNPGGDGTLQKAPRRRRFLRGGEIPTVEAGADDAPSLLTRECRRSGSETLRCVSLHARALSRRDEWRRGFARGAATRCCKI